MDLIEIEGLTVEFPTPRGTVRAVDNLSLRIARGETLGLVGESGSGKSVTAAALLGLIDPPGTVTEGRISLAGQSLLDCSERDMLHIRGKRIAVIFQEPSASLNPILTIGSQLLEALQTRVFDAWRAGPLHGIYRALMGSLGRGRRERRQALDEAVSLLSDVRIPTPDRMLGRYPYTFSGGMLQRVMIAIGLASRPDLLIADEPTTALDVTIQAQIVEILRERRDQAGLTILLITHDLGLIAEMCDRVVVLYAGQVMEHGPVEDLFDRPLHPYTRGLLASMPSLDLQTDRLSAIEGSVPDLTGLPRGACHFAWNDRCPLQTEVCRTERPVTTEMPGGRAVACHIYSHPEMRSRADALHALWPPTPVPA